MDDGRIGWISDCKFCQAIFLELNHNLLEASIYLKSPSESSEGLFSWDVRLGLRENVIASKVIASSGEVEVACKRFPVVGARDGDAVGGIGEHGDVGEDVADVRAAQGVCVDVVVFCAQAMDGQAAASWDFDDGCAGEGEPLLEIANHHDWVPSWCGGQIACNR